ncbi:hypothetical protein DEFR109230_03750 [Deinococcus frigens]
MHVHLAAARAVDQQTLAVRVRVRDVIHALRIVLKGFGLARFQIQIEQRLPFVAVVVPAEEDARIVGRPDEARADGLGSLPIRELTALAGLQIQRVQLEPSGPVGVKGHLIAAARNVQRRHRGQGRQSFQRDTLGHGIKCSTQNKGRT